MTAILLALALILSSGQGHGPLPKCLGRPLTPAMLRQAAVAGPGWVWVCIGSAGGWRLRHP